MIHKECVPEETTMNTDLHIQGLERLPKWISLRVRQQF